LLILGYSNQGELISHLNHKGLPGHLVESLLHRLGSTPILFSAQSWIGYFNGITLVSGLLSYIYSLVLSLSHRLCRQVIGVVDHHFYGRHRNGRPSGLNLHSSNSNLVWRRLLHESVGGVTRNVGLFCSNCDLEPVISTLRRTINHIIDFSVRPRCVQGKEKAENQALTLGDWIYPENLEQLIVYNTQFCCSREGVWRLLGNQLSNAFGAPILV
jgi:hypothetical protein